MMYRQPKPSRAFYSSLFLAILVAGCDSSTSPDDMPPGVPPSANRIGWQAIEPLTTPVSVIDDRRRVVISDAATWAAFWDEFHGAVEPKPALPPVDFTRQAVIAATMGQRPTGGYVIEVAAVFEAEGRLYPLIRETSPEASCVVPQVITAPAVAVIVDRADPDVSFVEEGRTTRCS